MDEDDDNNPRSVDDMHIQHYQQARVLDEIEAETKQQPLTSERRPIAVLEGDYHNARNFLMGIKALSIDYDKLRMIRGDGNCYYRAFLYSLLEQIQFHPGEGQRILEFFKTTSWKQILKQGYDEIALEVFYEAMVDLLDRVIQGTIGRDEFHSEMNQENGTSDYVTWYMRVVTASYLKQDPDRFLPFLLDVQAASDGEFLDMAQFCQRHVEPMGQECEQVQVLALAEAVGVKVTIAYLDGRQQQPDGNSTNGHGKLTSHQFGPENAVTHLTLLYRPGHYDILYRKRP